MSAKTIKVKCQHDDSFIQFYLLNEDGWIEFCTNCNYIIDMELPYQNSKIKKEKNEN
jgi:hypothetical protein